MVGRWGLNKGNLSVVNKFIKKSIQNLLISIDFVFLWSTDIFCPNTRPQEKYPGLVYLTIVILIIILITIIVNYNNIV